jgi:hypothetical protein
VRSDRLWAEHSNPARKTLPKREIDMSNPIYISRCAANVSSGETILANARSA